MKKTKYKILICIDLGLSCEGKYTKRSNYLILNIRNQYSRIKDYKKIRISKFLQDRQQLRKWVNFLKIILKDRIKE